MPKGGWAGLRRSMLAVAAGGLTACSLIVEQPVVRVVDVETSSIGLTGGSLRLTLEITNPNRFALNSEAFTYRLDLVDPPAEEGSEWRTLFDGAHRDPVSLPGRESTTVVVSAPFSYADVGGAVGRLLKRGELEYRFSGSFQFSLPLGGVTVPFDERGAFRP